MSRALWPLSAALSAVVALAVPCAQAAPHIPAYITAAVEDSARPAEDKQRDELRKPAATLAFAGVKPGEHVAELIPGGGYYTRLLSKVVGPSGKVYTLAPPPRPNARPGAPNMMETAKKIAADPAFSNVTVLPLSFGQNAPDTGFGLPEQVDLFWTSQNYHDLHNIPTLDIATFNKRVFDSLKPGGTYFVLDHAAAAGAGASQTQTLHRIDPATVKQEVEAAGFKYVGSSSLLHNPADTHEKRIFDPSIRGHTDQFILKFRKPG